MVSTSLLLLSVVLLCLLLDGHQLFPGCVIDNRISRAAVSAFVNMLCVV